MWVTRDAKQHCQHDWHSQALSLIEQDMHCSEHLLRILVTMCELCHTEAACTFLHGQQARHVTTVQASSLWAFTSCKPHGQILSSAH